MIICNYLIDYLNDYLIDYLINYLIDYLIDYLTRRKTYLTDSNDYLALFDEYLSLFDDNFCQFFEARSDRALKLVLFLGILTRFGLISQLFVIISQLLDII
jgi:hypothetical protein